MEEIKIDTLPAKNLTDNKTSNIWMYIIMAVLIIASILIVVFWLETPAPDLLSVACIANSTQLYMMTGCGACDNQKQILGEDLLMFDIIDCRENPDICTMANIKVVPTWVVGEKIYEGYRTIEELKEMTGC